MKTYTEIEKENLIAATIGLLPLHSVNKACRKTGVPPSTFKQWCLANESLYVLYARARKEFTDHLADEILSIADEAVAITPTGVTDHGEVQRAKLRIESRKWLLSKLRPQTYGDRITIAGDEDNPIKVVAIKCTVVDPKVKVEVDDPKVSDES